jgi:hypothetical protein
MLVQAIAACPSAPGHTTIAVAERTAIPPDVISFGPVADQA